MVREFLKWGCRSSSSSSGHIITLALLLTSCAGETKDVSFATPDICGTTYTVEPECFIRVIGDGSSIKYNITTAGCVLTFKSASPAGRLCIQINQLDFRNRNLQIDYHDSADPASADADKTFKDGGVYKIPQKFCSTGQVISLHLKSTAQSASISDIYIDIKVYNMEGNSDLQRSRQRRNPPRPFPLWGIVLTVSVIILCIVGLGTVTFLVRKGKGESADVSVDDDSWVCPKSDCGCSNPATRGSCKQCDTSKPEVVHLDRRNTGTATDGTLYRSLPDTGTGNKNVVVDSDDDDVNTESGRDVRLAVVDDADTTDGLRRGTDPDEEISGGSRKDSKMCSMRDTQDDEQSENSGGADVSTSVNVDVHDKKKDVVVKAKEERSSGYDNKVCIDVVSIDSCINSSVASVPNATNSVIHGKDESNVVMCSANDELITTGGGGGEHRDAGAANVDKCNSCSVDIATEVPNGGDMNVVADGGDGEPMTVSLAGPDSTERIKAGSVDGGSNSSSDTATIVAKVDIRHKDEGNDVNDVSGCNSCVEKQSADVDKVKDTNVDEDVSGRISVDIKTDMDIHEEGGVDSGGDSAGNDATKDVAAANNDDKETGITKMDLRVCDPVKTNVDVEEEEKASGEADVGVCENVPSVTKTGAENADLHVKECGAGGVGTGGTNSAGGATMTCAVTTTEQDNERDAEEVRIKDDCMAENTVSQNVHCETGLGEADGEKDREETGDLEGENTREENDEKTREEENGERGDVV